MNVRLLIFHLIFQKIVILNQIKGLKANLAAMKRSIEVLGKEPPKTMEFYEHEPVVMAKAEEIGHLEKNPKLEELVNAVLRISNDANDKYTKMDCLSDLLKLRYPEIHAAHHNEIINAKTNPGKYERIMSALSASTIEADDPGRRIFELEAYVINRGLSIADTLQLMLCGYVDARTDHKIPIKIIRRQVYSPIDKLNRLMNGKLINGLNGKKNGGFVVAHDCTNGDDKKKTEEKDKGPPVNIAEIIEKFVHSIHDDKTPKHTTPGTETPNTTQ